MVTLDAATNKRLVLDTLEDLEASELKKFQFHLNQVVMKAFHPILKYQLENAAREDTLDKIAQTYTLDGALKISKQVLRLKSCSNFSGRLKNTTENRPNSSSIDKISSSSSSSAYPRVGSRT